MIETYEITKDCFGVFETKLHGQEFIDFFDKWAGASMISHEGGRKDSQLALHHYDMMVTPGAPGLMQRYNDVVHQCLMIYMERFEYLKKITLQSLYLKVQKTSPSEGFHNWHSENSDAKNCRRILATTVYLNDVEEGGETEFLYLSKRIKPKAGRVVIWPAGFPYVHRGNPPLSGSKYILTSWLEVK